MPIYGLVLTLYVQSIPESFYARDSLFYLHDQHKQSFLVLFFIFTVAAPGLSLVMLRLNKTISSLELDNPKERSLPIGITALYFFLMFGFLVYQQGGFIPDILVSTSLGGFLSAILCLFITRKMKISLHAMGVGSLLGFLIGYFQTQAQFGMWIIYLVIAMGVITTTSRLILDKHTLKQTAWGYGLGFFVQLITIFIYSQL